MARRPGRPRASEGPVITREELLRVACRLVARHGIDGTSVRRLAEAAGISMGTLQHHFRTKDDLHRAIVDEVMVPSFARAVAATNPAEGIEQDIRVWVEGAVLQPGLSAQLLLDPDDARFEYLDQAMRAFREADRAEMEALCASGQLRPIHRPSLIVLLGVVMPLVSSLARVIRRSSGLDLSDADDRDALVHGLTDILLYGVLARPDDD